MTRILPVNWTVFSSIKSLRNTFPVKTPSGQDMARGFATVILARAADESVGILGYYAFSAASIPIVSLSAKTSGKMPVTGMLRPYF